MLAAFLTAGLWTIAAVSATRGSRLVGSVPFNLVRLLSALLLLAIWGHAFGGGLSGPWVLWFVLSGVIGFGLGDMAGYTALKRMGSRLSMLIVHCLAMPSGALIEWLWLGTTLTPVELSLGALILCGVAVASVMPRELSIPARDLGIGIATSTLAAVAQAVGAVTSRKAYALAESASVDVDAGTATYQRTIGGVAVLLVGALLLWRGTKQQKRDWNSVPRWVLIHTLSGPVIGVACFQWALSTTPAGVVLPVLATIPLLVIPLAYVLEGERPTRRAIVGGLVAVGAAGLLAALR